MGQAETSGSNPANQEYSNQTAGSSDVDMGNISGNEGNTSGEGQMCLARCSSNSDCPTATLVVKQV